MSRIQPHRGAVWRDNYVTCFDGGSEGLRCHGSGLIEVPYEETDHLLMMMIMMMMVVVVVMMRD